MSLKSGLYIISTPIGNLGDITLRAVETLSSSDYILCEDTRVARKILQKLNINNEQKLIVYNDFSTEWNRSKILELFNDQNIISLISDAGTPLISDPGYKLVRELQENNIYIDINPGVSSTIAALTLSGLPTDRFLFAGFIPKSDLARENFFKELQNSCNATIILFETSLRLCSSLQKAQEILGNREACIARELTKIYQEAKRDSLSELISYYTQTPPKGEVVVVISGKPSDDSINENQLSTELEKLLLTMSAKDATNFIYAKYKQLPNISRNIIYKLANSLKC